MLLLALAACSPAPPSILVVTLDTLRRDHVGAYGSVEGLTPNLDALAAQGLVHDNAYTTMPTTGPAHISLFTGLSPSEHGSRRNGEPLAGDAIRRDVSAQLRRRGWATAAFVTTRLAGRAATGLSGFEVYDEPAGVIRHGEDAVADALAWLRVETRRPVLLWVQIYDPHSPYGTADDKRRSYPVDPGRYGWIASGQLDDPAERRELRRRYGAGVRAADAALGTLVRGAQELLDGRLQVLIVADHGESLEEHLESRGWGFDHGEFLDREAVTIPCVVVGPGVSAGRSQGTASIRDLYGTILAVAGIADPEAPKEHRRDLRYPDSGPRIVGIERRRSGLAARPAVRRHRAAAAEGEEILIVGEDGSWTAGPQDAPELARAAGALAAVAEGQGVELPPETVEALRSLGYAE